MGVWGKEAQRLLICQRHLWEQERTVSSSWLRWPVVNPLALHMPKAPVNSNFPTNSHSSWATV